MSVPIGEQDDVAFLATLDVISADDAATSALAAQSGAVQQVELESENGAVVFGVEILTGAGDRLARDGGLSTPHVAPPSPLFPRTFLNGPAAPFHQQQMRSK